jgi:ParB-like nuclease domain
VQVAERVEITGVHPVAGLFPMMTEDELDEMAEDIRANGLIHPIVIDGRGILIDGRNRLEACRRADVEPAFSQFEGNDPGAFILSTNVTRRHLNKGQQAMAVVKAGNLSTKLTTREAGESIRVSHEYINRAAIILDYAPEVADAVLAGATALNEAYQEARRRKAEFENRKQDEARRVAKLKRLEADAPDLATLVQEERLTLEEALYTYEERRRREEQYALTVAQNLRQVLDCLSPGNVDPDVWARDFLKARADPNGRPDEFSAERAERAAAILLRYAAFKREANAC